MRTPSRFRVRLIVNLNQLFHGNVRVNLRRRQTRVARKFSKITQVSVAIEYLSQMKAGLTLAAQNNS
ncbi:MAG TPA: hypothetical protein VGJ55_11070 [Pyrinomonadaceae bacterium]